MRAISGFLVVLALVPACSSSKKAGVREAFGGSAASRREVRLRVTEYFRLFTGTIELTSDNIVRSTEDPVTTRRALRLKIDTVAACQSAAFHADADAALVDIWAFVHQLNFAFTEGDGKDAFGDQQYILVEAMEKLVDELGQLEKYLPGDPAESRAGIEEWAARNPVEIRGYRPSTAPRLAELTGDPKMGAFDVVANLPQQMTDLSDRMTVLAETIPRQVRWQAEFIIDEIQNAKETKETLDLFARMSDSLDRVATIEDRIPDLLEEQRALVMADVHTEINIQRPIVMTMVEELVGKQRDWVLTEVDEQRDLILAALQKEREIILETVDRQMDDVFKAVEKEREAILAAVDEQRVATLEEAHKIMDDGLQEARKLIDHFFWRLVQACGALIVFFFLARLAFLRLAPKP